MSIALVGTRPSSTSSTTGGSCTPAWGTSQNRTQYNLLLLWVTGLGTATLPTTPSGWSIAFRKAGQGSLASASLFYKVAAGSDAAPTIAGATSTVWIGELSEFSGALGQFGGSPLDQSAGGTTNTATPVVATAAGVDTYLGSLIAATASLKNSSARTNSTGVHTLNNGATSTDNNNNGNNGVNHFSFTYGFTTGNGSADSDSYAFDDALFSDVALAIASFKPIINITVTAPVASFTASAAAPVPLVAATPAPATVTPGAAAAGTTVVTATPSPATVTSSAAAPVTVTSASPAPASFAAGAAAPVALVVTAVFAPPANVGVSAAPPAATLVVGAPPASVSTDAAAPSITFEISSAAAHVDVGAALPTVTITTVVAAVPASTTLDAAAPNVDVPILIAAAPASTAFSTPTIHVVAISTIRPTYTQTAADHVKADDVTSTSTPTVPGVAFGAGTYGPGLFAAAGAATVTVSDRPSG